MSYESNSARILRDGIDRMNARRAREGLPPALRVTEQTQDRRYTFEPCECGDAFCAGCEGADEKDQQT
jgi:hypothetical protein